MDYDVIVIGGGPSGLMAAIAAAENDARVLLLDKGDKLGRKLAISGGGRCNVTNAMPIESLIAHIPGNGRFLHSALSAFDNRNIISFFEQLGVALKEEDHGRMFPVSNNAKSVVGALLERMNQLHVTIKTHAPAQAVLYDERTIGAKLKSGEKISAVSSIVAVGGKSVPQTGPSVCTTDMYSKKICGVQLKSGEIIKAKKVIVAVGGKSVPQTGSTGDGYSWAKAAGHTITALYPTEVPLTSNETFIKNKTLQGLSLSDVSVTLVNPKGRPLMTHRWDMVFTHFGLSGPAILRLSQFVVKALKKFKTHEVTVLIDTKPEINEQELYEHLTRISKNDPKKAIKNVWKGIVPERYLNFLFEFNSISPDHTFYDLSKEDIRKMAHSLKAFPIKINGTLSLEKAFITGGGVSLKEINPKTMESKFVSGLYFCGEILDVHGYTGGYNITAAFTTGHAAGIAAAQTSRVNQKS
ncbi:NAD(P)/FAD-dependent oxidoreductase [Sporolactobacillus sp. CPB3-1]|uniref:NAD(P)/FAD-dependent oxidoreductase n=1 Tax=Sporolactobacillus mangiferae TaxID=2940498 RepID=A0ABT0MA80_9BACL|nr:NAD(P)/FAD-dependent oxidoreductase [Sporolactobacillus mangiferae]MCL1631782.1 NAD(P)/FAD-dependent oxidoreductase [Sporolactobacillus mangiferae]